MGKVENKMRSANSLLNYSILHKKWLIGYVFVGNTGVPRSKLMAFSKQIGVHLFVQDTVHRSSKAWERSCKIEKAETAFRWDRNV
ncbi:hypothetical protein OUZ56_021413 [Daphnia magna]|uniref:Uncharacterized protein n=1 Tax=Daphnia magna TaxID=35525 RepID=A0ABQ9ZHA2_9CRUS|nr:hypothetical protein OUZ56_021413 [Daphnia magna]